MSADDQKALITRIRKVVFNLAKLRSMLFDKGFEKEADEVLAEAHELKAIAKELEDRSAGN